MVSPEKLDALQRQWVQLVQPLGVGYDLAYPAFDRLVLAYSESHRHYHTLEHLAEMFRVAARLMKHAESPTAIQFAIWFHDAIYDPKAQDNEERSAELALHELEALRIPSEISSRTADLIVLTKHDSGSTSGADAAILLDADLAILGAEPARYQRYAADVRKEYDWVPDEMYRSGRVAVLESFLQRGSIYHCQLMQVEGESSARLNLRNEIAQLQG